MWKEEGEEYIREKKQANLQRKKFSCHITDCISHQDNLATLPTLIAIIEFEYRNIAECNSGEGLHIVLRLSS